MKTFRMSRIALFSAGLMLLGLTIVACNQQPKSSQEADKEIRQKSAEVTATVKKGAEETAAETKDAAAKAEEKLDAVAAGVKDGLNSNTRIDLNSATAEEISTLPGIDLKKANQIVKDRPYGSSHDLVAKGILSESHFERISPQVTAR
jgi:DNA uptake protein ComE-like DNA-binding protein